MIDHDHHLMIISKPLSFPWRVLPGRRRGTLLLSQIESFHDDSVIALFGAAARRLHLKVSRFISSRRTAAAEHFFSSSRCPFFRASFAVILRQVQPPLCVAASVKLRIAPTASCAAGLARRRWSLVSSMRGRYLNSNEIESACRQRTGKSAGSGRGCLGLRSRSFRHGSCAS